MDTKLKNSRNVRIGIIIIGLLLAVGVNVSLFPWMIRNAEQKSAQLFSSSENVNTEYIDTLYQGAYVLYTEIKNEPSENRTESFVGEGSGYDDSDCSFFVRLVLLLTSQFSAICTISSGLKLSILVNPCPSIRI